MLQFQPLPLPDFEPTLPSMLKNKRKQSISFPPEVFCEVQMGHKLRVLHRDLNAKRFPHPLVEWESHSPASPLPRMSLNSNYLLTD